jgi:hypothetical protein
LRGQFELGLGLREERFGHGQVFLGKGDLPRILLDHAIPCGFLEPQGRLGHLTLGPGHVQFALMGRRVDLGEYLSGLDAVVLLDEHSRDQAANLGREVDDVRLDEGVVGHRPREPVEGELTDHPDADHDPHQGEGPPAEDQESPDPPPFGGDGRCVASIDEGRCHRSKNPRASERPIGSSSPRHATGQGQQRDDDGDDAQ